MYIDEYWNKFIENGSVEAYLNFASNKKEQGKLDDRTNPIYNRWTDNKGAGDR